MSEDAANLTERAEQAVRRRAEGRTTPCSCDELLEHLFEFLDSELDDDQQARFRRHAEECRTCTEATDAEQHIRALVRRSCSEVAPSSLRMRVQSQLTVLRVNGIRAVD
jgi:mycothiol system anti-sigma-R factor